MPHSCNVLLPLFQPLNLCQFSDIMEFRVACHDNTIQFLRGNNDKCICIRNRMVGFDMRRSKDGLVIRREHFNGKTLDDSQSILRSP